MPITFTDVDGQRWSVLLRPNAACIQGGKVGDLRKMKQEEADQLRDDLGDERSARAVESLTLIQWLQGHGAIERAERR